MIDIEYINELKELDLKEGKAALAAYAKGFGLDVKKNQSFDKMVEEIKSKLQELADEPMPENNEGLSINDIMRQYGQSDVIDTGAPILLQDSPIDEQEIKVLDVVQPVDTAQIELAVVVKPQDVAVEVALDNKIVEVVPALVAPASAGYELPKNYSPSLTMLGAGQHSYVTLPWWIYEWITQNPGWKSNPNSFPHYHGLDTLLSLIYYIQRDGQVRIRETRNSSFQILN